MEFKHGNKNTTRKQMENRMQMESRMDAANDSMLLDPSPPLLQAYPDLLQDDDYSFTKTTSPVNSRWNLDDWKESLQSLCPVTEETFDEAWSRVKTAFDHFGLTPTDDFINNSRLKKTKFLQKIFMLISFFDNEEKLQEELGYLSKKEPLQNQPLSPSIIEGFDCKADFILRENEEPAVTGKLRSELEEMAKLYRNGDYFFPYTAITQSSGMGKSYHVSQLRRFNCWLFYSSVQSDKMDTFPRRSSVANLLLHPANFLRKALSSNFSESDQRLTGQVYRCFFTACFYELQNWILKETRYAPTFPVSKTDLHKLQDEWGKLQLDPDTEKAFWDRIIERTAQIASYFKRKFIYFGKTFLLRCS